MQKWKLLGAMVGMSLAGSAFAQSNPFSDVPRTHWAYGAIQKAVQAGILQGFDGKFHGEKLVNRYQMAVIIKKILDHVGSSGGHGGGMKTEDIQNLEALTIEFADELALLNVKVSTLEDSFVELRNEVDALKRGGMHHGGGGSTVGNAFTGFVSVGLISTDDASGATAPTPAGNLTRFGGTSPDQTFFTVPQASIALDTEVSEGIGLHVQYDYATDAPGNASVGGTGAGAGLGGNGVALNEAYLFVDELFGDVGGKIGGFALPLQSWEINGPFRTLNDTITPSAKGTALESVRVVGLELTKTKDVDPSQVQWRLGIFNGNDVATTGGSGAAAVIAGYTAGTLSAVGAQTDATGLGGFSGTTTNDDSLGFYIDIESGNDPDRNWGWRLGWFDRGGDVSATAPATASEEVDGWQIGFWWKNDTFKVTFEWMDFDNTFGAGAPAAAVATELDANTWYLAVNWKMNDDSSITIRYDDWENELNTVGTATGFEGDAITFAWNRRLSDTSMFQFEYIAPDSDTIPSAANTDFDDDLIQFRYKVWF